MAGVTITYVFSDNGILSQAQSATSETDSATVLEEIQTRLLAIQLGNTDTWAYTNADVIDVIKDVTGVTVDEWDDDFTTENGNTVTISSLWVGNRPISTTDSYVGYYADINDDGTVDGIIYVDLMHEQQYDYWRNSSGGTYSWTVLTDGVKSYYISEEGYSDDFGTHDVLSPIPGTYGEDRFFVMALDDLDVDLHCWYASAYGNMSDYEEATSEDFGSGYNNTETMISYWNDDKYGTKNAGSYTDMWGLSELQTAFAGGWFIPSRREWFAFAGELEITNSNYESFRSDKLVLEFDAV